MKPSDRPVPSRVLVRPAKTCDTPGKCTRVGGVLRELLSQPAPEPSRAACRCTRNGIRERGLVGSRSSLTLSSERLPLIGSKAARRGQGSSARRGAGYVLWMNRAEVGLVGVGRRRPNRCCFRCLSGGLGWRRGSHSPHNPKVAGSNPAPATTKPNTSPVFSRPSGLGWINSRAPLLKPSSANSR